MVLTRLKFQVNFGLPRSPWFQGPQPCETGMSEMPSCRPPEPIRFRWNRKRASYVFVLPCVLSENASHFSGRTPRLRACEKIVVAGPEDSVASFPRKRESIYQAGTSSYMGTRLRGYDAAADLNPAIHVSGNIGVIKFRDDGSEAIEPVRYKAFCYFAAVAMNSISTCAPPGSAAMPMVLRAG